MDESTAVTYIGMSIDELSPYLDRLQASLLGCPAGRFRCWRGAVCMAALFSILEEVIC